MVTGSTLEDDIEQKGQHYGGGMPLSLPAFIVWDSGALGAEESAELSFDGRTHEDPHTLPSLDGFTAHSKFAAIQVWTATSGTDAGVVLAYTYFFPEAQFSLVSLFLIIYVRLQAQFCLAIKGEAPLKTQHRTSVQDVDIHLKDQLSIPLPPRFTSKFPRDDGVKPRHLLVTKMQETGERCGPQRKSNNQDKIKQDKAGPRVLESPVSMYYLRIGGFDGLDYHPSAPTQVATIVSSVQKYCIRSLAEIDKLNLEPTIQANGPTHSYNLSSLVDSTRTNKVRCHCTVSRSRTSYGGRCEAESKVLFLLLPFSAPIHRPMYPQGMLPYDKTRQEFRLETTCYDRQWKLSYLYARSPPQLQIDVSDALRSLNVSFTDSQSTTSWVPSSPLGATTAAMENGNLPWPSNCILITIDPVIQQQPNQFRRTVELDQDDNGFQSFNGLRYFVRLNTKAQNLSKAMKPYWVSSAAKSTWEPLFPNHPIPSYKPEESQPNAQDRKLPQPAQAPKAPWLSSQSPEIARLGRSITANRAASLRSSDIVLTAPRGLPLIPSTPTPPPDHPIHPSPHRRGTEVYEDTPSIRLQNPGLGLRIRRWQRWTACYQSFMTTSHPLQLWGHQSLQQQQHKTSPYTGKPIRCGCVSPSSTHGQSMRQQAILLAGLYNKLLAFHLNFAKAADQAYSIRSSSVGFTVRLLNRKTREPCFAKNALSDLSSVPRILAHLLGPFSLHLSHAGLCTQIRNEITRDVFSMTLFVTSFYGKECPETHRWSTQSKTRQYGSGHRAQGHVFSFYKTLSPPILDACIRVCRLPPADLLSKDTISLRRHLAEAYSKPHRHTNNEMPVQLNDGKLKYGSKQIDSRSSRRGWRRDGSGRDSRETKTINCLPPLSPDEHVGGDDDDSLYRLGIFHLLCTSRPGKPFHAERGANLPENKKSCLPAAVSNRRQCGSWSSTNDSTNPTGIQLMRANVPRPLTPFSLRKLNKNDPTTSRTGDAIHGPGPGPSGSLSLRIFAPFDSRPEVPAADTTKRRDLSLFQTMFWGFNHGYICRPKGTNRPCSNDHSPRGVSPSSLIPVPLGESTSLVPEFLNTQVIIRIPPTDHLNSRRCQMYAMAGLSALGRPEQMLPACLLNVQATQRYGKL
ncbi:uncharacterized protein CLUP02_06217 [Colletotrichum lupini]|uniref:Uncharacterized protein n=1 Tax=Colletotrichum lupini TaxID=145971 RepID=A0A9Q8SQH9_9PEZI|nr:uncharacterized protein CLUP02_06217 [Colletotrichum lupini]UQC80732.1 hypothetical protein CLUP02_06217 [Colletotrichum lupini]